ncbi:class I SAM-dependent rRNA methyltransferase [Aestuariirhabdus litorea]|uniref:Class I SAM-dependent rRNA methyltransferase n=1 Tax=Aestuariirhabdus litorea TaxID=2528527 RepID=A0A3P3VK21_9GAMM|nr:class I SAM-dependent rRNA methyltransferase [Aestuariirhabdus litorea]RRJ83081.1 class I SAM-dependent rRNA methyltransferase [Aestuariirhabdus litorea]RWW93239.1 methyltransferase domain-containing protein [Endozoicomonadaceae bacterium GTF-13]
MNFNLLRLKPKAERRLSAGHLWIYSNEVDTKATPLTRFEAGEQVVVETASGKPLGVAYVNPNTLICGRMVSRDLKHGLNKSLLVHRIQRALSLRERAFEDPCYRLVYGDSDGLPGLVVDRFNDLLVVQIATAGMERVRDEVVTALQQVLNPAAIVLKNSGQLRRPEALDEYTEVVVGEVTGPVPLRENGVNFLAPVLDGQKTGWFYDHRMSRARLQHYARGQRVLDLFSYIGGWGVQAAAAGAEEVVCVDASASALEYVHENARLNGLEERVSTLQGDAFAALKQLREEQQRFDLIVVDPPAFIKRRKDIKAGEQAYRRINEQAMRLLSRDGVMVSASCSMHLQRDNLVDILRLSSRHLDRQLQIIEQGHQGADHPIHPSIPETEYLKAIFCRVCLA